MRALLAVDADGAARARLVCERLQPGGLVVVAPLRHGLPGNAQSRGHGTQSLAAVQFQEGGGALEDSGGGAAFGNHRQEDVMVGSAQSERFSSHVSRKRSKGLKT